MNGKPKSGITQADLKSLLDYDAETGVFQWKKDGFKRTAGSIAGATSHRRGYRLISLGARGKAYLAHRLAWLYVYGEFPENEIDHIDRNTDNNAISNLRACNRRQNAYNTVRHSGETSEFPGVSWDKSRLLWATRIRLPCGKRKFIGRFDDENKAAEAYLQAKIAINPFAEQPGVFGWTKL